MSQGWRTWTRNSNRLAGVCLLLVVIAASQNQPVKSPAGSTAPLIGVDIGNPSIRGSLITTNSGLAVTASGKDIWGTADEFHFAYQKQTGDFDAVTRVESLTAAHLYSKAGLMAREDLSAGSRHIFFLVFPDNRPRHNNNGGYELQYRDQTGSESHAIYPPQNTGSPPFPVSFPKVWLRLKRAGNTFTGYVSVDGAAWKEYSSYSMDLPATLYLGLAVTSHAADLATTAQFRDLRVQYHKSIAVRGTTR